MEILWEKYSGELLQAQPVPTVIIAMVVGEINRPSHAPAFSKQAKEYPT